MEAVLSKEDRDAARSFCIDEYTDHLIYSHLASREGRDDFKKLLKEMAEQEYRHYEFWKSVAGTDCRAAIPKWKLTLTTLSRLLFGLTFTVKFLEMHETQVIEAYRGFMGRLPDEMAAKLGEILKDEEYHERALLSELNESVVKYIGFIALGFADAVIEITGVHAGFLGATTTTLVAGIAGLIVGLSAAISMAAAAYIQAKHNGLRNPLPSAAATGIAYMIAVVLLAAPYFFTHSNVLAFVVSVMLAFALVVTFTFYSSVINESNFSREVLETTIVLFVTSLLSYIFGTVLGKIFGLQSVFH